MDWHGGRFRPLTFGQLDRASASVAGLLHRAGLRPGDRVIVLQPMSADLYIALGAMFRIGLVAMVPDLTGGLAAINRCCAFTAPRAMVGGFKAHLLRISSSELRRIPHKFSIGWLRVPGAIPLQQRWDRLPGESIRPCSFDEPALLTFTSGSTGESKAAMRSHGFLLEQHKALEQAIDLQHGEVDFNTLPIFVLANLASGVTSVLPRLNALRPAAIDPVTMVRQIDQCRATRLSTSPAVCERLAEYCEEHAKALPSLQRIYAGGGPVTATLMERLQQIAPHARVTAVYGSTEAEPIARVSYQEISTDDRRAMLAGCGLLAGSPVPSIRLRIIPDQCGSPVGPYRQSAFDAMCLQRGEPGEPGEIVVSGLHVLPGYINGQGDRENKFAVDGERWHRTGDAGYLDKQGRLWLLGRCSAGIKDRYGTLYPFMVDQVAARHPGVRRAAVVAHRDQRVVAVELAAATRSQVDLVSLMDSLSFARVTQVRIVNRLPMDARHNAKVDYPALRAMLERPI
jgi:acyl-coenzyme A synthetase/AMP-(fatty) acid ligase